MYYQKKKRELTGRCNICGRVGLLTYDHIPPKCCGNIGRVRYNPMFEGVPTENRYHTESQNGFKFRSICENCNNNVLGEKYDPVMKEYYDGIESYVYAKITLPPVVSINIKINRLCRTICGHMLAIKTAYEDKNTMDVQLREYVLDEARLPPKGMKLLNWVYGYNTTIVAQDFTVKCIEAGKIARFPDDLCRAVYSFPVAFLVTYSKEKCGLIDLFSYCTNDIDEIVTVPIDLYSIYYTGTKKLRHFAWPLNVSDDNDGVSMALVSNSFTKDSVLGFHFDKNAKNWGK